MATQQTHTLALAPRERSIELAEARGHAACSWSAQLIGSLEDETGPLVNAAWYIESATSYGRYLVIYEAATDDATCDCPAAQHRTNAACWHRGLAIIKGRSLAARLSAAGRAAEERAWRLEQEAEENYQALRPSF